MKTSSIAYSIVNFFGLTLALLVILRFHYPQIEHGTSFGDGMAFAFALFPLIVICLSVNLAWAGMAIADIVRRREKTALVAWSICVVLWGALAAMYFTCWRPIL